MPKLTTPHIGLGSHLAILPLLFFSTSCLAQSQAVDHTLTAFHVRGVPFSAEAEWGREFRTAGKIVHVEGGYVARATNRSTFMSFKNEDGTVYRITDLWLSPDLALVVLWDQRRPASDFEATMTVSEVNRAEPPAELFVHQGLDSGNK